MTKAGVTEKDIGKVVGLGPELLGCNIVHKLDVNVKYFLSLGIRHRQLGEMITDFPLLLRYNPDVLRPKYIYLRRSMVRPLKDVIEFPRYHIIILSRNFENIVLDSYFFTHWLFVINYLCPSPLSGFSAILLRVELSQGTRF